MMTLTKMKYFWKTKTKIPPKILGQKGVFPINYNRSYPFKIHSILLISWFGIFRLYRFFFLDFFLRQKKGVSHVAVIIPHPRYSWVNPWVPLAWTGVRKLQTHTHPKLYWFLGLPEITITVLVRTWTWDMVKS